MTLPAILLTGAKFPPNFKSSDITQTPWGTITFTFSDLQHRHRDLGTHACRLHRRHAADHATHADRRDDLPAMIANVVNGGLWTWTIRVHRHVHCWVRS